MPDVPPPAAPEEEDRAPLAPGTQIGRFVLREPLGIGGFGITYKAEDPMLGRPVAIKELFLDGCQRAGADVTGGTIFRQTRDRFLAEARLLAALEDHPNLLQVHEVIQANGTVYIATAFVQGRTSKALLAGARGGLPELRVLGIMEQVAAALEHVHAGGVLHRDVKPDNVMLAPKPRGWPYEDWVILIDFGAARELLDHSQAMTRVLTPGFAPLEQYAESYRYGAPLDVYGLAATGYYLLSGKVPVNAADRSIVDRLVPLRELRPDLSDEMVDGITRGLALRPDDRIQSPAALIEVCRSSSLAGRPAPVDPPTLDVLGPDAEAPDATPPTSPTVPVDSPFAPPDEPEPSQPLTVPLRSPRPPETAPAPPAPVAPAVPTAPAPPVAPAPPTVPASPVLPVPPDEPLPVRPVAPAPQPDPFPATEPGLRTAPLPAPPHDADRVPRRRGSSRALLLGGGAVAALVACGVLVAATRTSTSSGRAITPTTIAAIATTAAPSVTTTPSTAPVPATTDATTDAATDDPPVDTTAAAPERATQPTTAPVGPLTATLAVAPSNGAVWGWTPTGSLATSGYAIEPRDDPTDAHTFDALDIYPPGAGSQNPSAIIKNPLLFTDVASGIVDVKWSKGFTFLAVRAEADGATDLRRYVQCQVHLMRPTGVTEKALSCGTDADWLDDEHLLMISGSFLEVWSLDGSSVTWPDDLGTPRLVRVSADGRQVAVIDATGATQVITVGPDRLPISVRTLHGTVGAPSSLRWVGTRNVLAAAGADRLALWDLGQTGGDALSIDGHGTAVGASSDGSLLAFDDGSTATVLSVADGNVVARFDHEPFETTQSIEFSPMHDIIVLNGLAADGSGLRRAQFWYLRPT